ncbi:hypothetical protein RHMOL_Rhmol12G0093100 [Rhododendron molle]|uniref:Uncharacterized protein n=1 Tax=Rhododendron molle TaxID=49168 RepID=A0ACC0LGZ9_RHOML|nr:hypothetical protein RHMOL_Rhmol12G0093100 [Rhododendron molle]
MRRRRAVARGADAWVVAVTVRCSSYSGQKTYNNSTISGWGRPMEAGNLFLLRPIVIRIFNPKQPPQPPSLPPRLPSSFRVSSNLQRGYRGPKPRREWEADWVSRNDDAVLSLPIYIGAVSLLADLVNCGISGIAPVADASSSQSRADLLTVGLAVTNILAGLVWLSIRPKTIVAISPHGVECLRLNPQLPDFVISELIWRSFSDVLDRLLFDDLCTFSQDLGIPVREAVPIDASTLMLGALYLSVLNSGSQSYLANLSLYPGKSELPFLPPNMQHESFSSRFIRSYDKRTLTTWWRSSCNRLETKELQLLVEIRLGDLRLLTRCSKCFGRLPQALEALLLSPTIALFSLCFIQTVVRPGSSRKRQDLKRTLWLGKKISANIAEASITFDELNVVINSYREGLVSHPDVTLEDLDSIEILHLHISQLRLKWLTIFMWQDGPLVHAMKNGDLLLVDEISLADDRALERLNSVLEPERKLSLVEKGGLDLEKITAHPVFMILATMNPGGDYGKNEVNELSPALQNQFTEIWVPPVNELNELRTIDLQRISEPGRSYVVDSMVFPISSPCFSEKSVLPYMMDMITYTDTYVVVVGAGSARLSWAYELSKNPDVQSFTFSLDLGTLDLFRPVLTHLYQQGIKEPPIRQAKMDVEALLNEKMKTKNKLNLKEKCDQMMDYIKGLWLCIMWFQELEGNYLLEQEKHKDLLETTENKCTNMAGARYWDDDFMVAVILGTGTNACDVECVNAIPKLQSHISSFGRTFDRDMDAASINPGEQIFEKTIYDVYRGEIVRQVLLKMAEASDLSRESNMEKLSTQFVLRYYIHLFFHALVSSFLLDESVEEMDENCLNGLHGDEPPESELDLGCKNFNYSYDCLKDLDPYKANRIHPNDHKKIFTSLSYIMMYLLKYLVPDAVHVLRVTAKLRFYPKDYVQEFMADTVAFLLRNAEIDQTEACIRRVIVEVAKKPLVVRKSGVRALL